jgi:hypothetical protein
MCVRISTRIWDVVHVGNTPIHCLLQKDSLFVLKGMMSRTGLGNVGSTSMHPRVPWKSKGILRFPCVAGRRIAHRRIRDPLHTVKWMFVNQDLCDFPIRHVVLFTRPTFLTMSVQQVPWVSSIRMV